MTPTEINLTIAKALGYTANFYEDLNAMAGAEQTLGWEELNEYIEVLKEVVKGAYADAYCAKSPKRAEAFCRVKGLWKE